MKKKQKQSRLIRAGIQLLFFLAAPSLFSTAFAGIKSVFTAIGNHKALSWNSFLDVTVILLAATCLLGRHFCGYLCAFGSLGDAVYEGFCWILRTCFHIKKKPGYSEKTVTRLQKVKYLILVLILFFCISGRIQDLQGSSPWDVFSLLMAGKIPGASYQAGMILFLLILAGMCTQERFFCQFLCPMGAVFALMPVSPQILFHRSREKCPAKCGLCKKRCPAHLDIDGDTPRSGECLCCHACLTACPKGNIHMGESEVTVHR